MDDHVETIEQQIRADRRALNRNIQELEDRAQAAMDWRRQFGEHTGAIMAVAFTGGVILGAVSRAARGYEGPDTREYEGPDTAMPRRRSLLRAVDPSGRATHHVSEIVEDVVDAFVALAGTAAVEYIAEAVPGFRQQFEARARRPI